MERAAVFAVAVVRAVAGQKGDRDGLQLPDAATTAISDRARRAGLLRDLPLASVSSIEASSDGTCIPAEAARRRPPRPSTARRRPPRPSMAGRIPSFSSSAATREGDMMATLLHVSYTVAEEKAR